ncbi:MAG: HK97 family phage prohead protease [Treponema sp.]|jgi:HK97 family phage prohead protease|nr:HK97 family phage prohead protease [Treponema sp.]
MSDYKITGTPIVYNRETVLYDSETFRWVEKIESGAARDALFRAEQVLLWQHDTAKPMASRTNKTLTVREDIAGVHIEADAGGTVWGRDGVEAIRAGIVAKMSFGFYLKEDGYTEEKFVENGKRVLKRTIKKFARIVDFSPVTYPAYSDTAVSARDADGQKDEFTKSAADGLQRRYGGVPQVSGMNSTRQESIEEVIQRTQQGLRFLKPRPVLRRANW